VRLNLVATRQTKKVVANKPKPKVKLVPAKLKLVQEKRNLAVLLKKQNNKVNVYVLN
jgi:hypothetical protein